MHRKLPLQNQKLLRPLRKKLRNLLNLKKLKQKLLLKLRNLQYRKKRRLHLRLFRTLKILFPKQSLKYSLLPQKKLLHHRQKSLSLLQRKYRLSLPKHQKLKQHRTFLRQFQVLR